MNRKREENTRFRNVFLSIMLVDQGPVPLILGERFVISSGSGTSPYDPTGGIRELSLDPYFDPLFESHITKFCVRYDIVGIIYIECISKIA